MFSNGFFKPVYFSQNWFSVNLQPVCANRLEIKNRLKINNRLGKKNGWKKTLDDRHLRCFGHSGILQTSFYFQPVFKSNFLFPTGQYKSVVKEHWFKNHF